MNLESFSGKLLLVGAGVYGLLLAAALLLDLCMTGTRGAAGPRHARLPGRSSDLRRQAAGTS